MILNYINPNVAIDGNNDDVTKLLSAEDQNYFVPHCCVIHKKSPFPP